MRLLASPALTITVAPLPPPPEDGSAPYLRLLYEALERHSVQVRRVTRVPNRADGLDVVHLHWLEYLTKPEGPRGLRAARAHWRAARLVLALTALRRRGVRIVWTVHNLRPHESRYPWLEAALARSVGRVAHALIVHSRYAARRVVERIGAPGKLHVIPHGHFRDLYPPSGRSRAELRAALGLPPDAYVYLVFGQLRAYKRVPETIRAFRALQDSSSRLLVAGRARDPEVRAAIEAEAARDERVITRLGYVPDEEVADLHLAADAAIVAYREVFSSGALLLALGLGLPVVAPADSAARELAGPPAVETFAGERLTEGLAAVATGDQEERRAAALEAALRCGWEGIAADTAAVYRGDRRPDRISSPSPSPSRSA